MSWKLPWKINYEHEIAENVWFSYSNGMRKKLILRHLALGSNSKIQTTYSTLEHSERKHAYHVLENPSISTKNKA